MKSKYIIRVEGNLFNYYIFHNIVNFNLIIFITVIINIMYININIYCILSFMIKFLLKYNTDKNYVLEKLEYKL